MRRHWWRIPAALLIAASGLALTVEPAEASPAAPDLMTFVCPPGSSPEVCSAVATIEITLKALELISPGLAPAWLVSIMDDLSVTAPLPDYEAKFEEILTEVCSGGSTAPGCLEWDGRDDAIKQRIKEAAKQANLLAEACASGVFSWSWVCPDPNEDADPGQPTYLAIGGTPTYEGDANRTWPGSPVPQGGGQAFVIPVHPGTGTTATTYTATMGQWGVSGSPAVKLVIEWSRAGTSGAWTSYRGRLEVLGWAGASTQWTTSQSIPADAIHVFFGLRVHTVSGDCSSQCFVGVDTWVGNANQIGTSTLNWSGWNRMGYDAFQAGASYNSGTGLYVQNYSSISTATMDEKAVALNPLSQLIADPVVEVPPRPGTEDEPTPTTEVAPSSTTMPPTPSSIVPPANPTGTHEERQTGLLENLVSGVANGFNWLGNFLGGLLRSVVDMIRWLGDIFGYWIRWLWERMGALLRQIKAAINSVGDLMEWLLQQVIDGIASLGEGLWSLLQATWNLPELIWQKFLNGLQLLFIPTDLPAAPPCAETFPCNWVAEANGTIGELKAGIDGAGGCVAPSIGWSQFSASFPPPPGCSGGNGIAADAAPGDLFGWRTTIRNVLALALWIGFLGKLLQMAPWSRPGDMPLGEGQVTV